MFQGTQTTDQTVGDTWTDAYEAQLAAMEKCGMLQERCDFDGTGQCKTCRRHRPAAR